MKEAIWGQTRGWRVEEMMRPIEGGEGEVREGDWMGGEAVFGVVMVEDMAKWWRVGWVVGRVFVA